MRFWPRWRPKCFSSLHNQRKDNNQFKNKEQPELPENQLYGSPTTKTLKKHSSKLVGEVEKAAKAKRTRSKAKLRTTQEIPHSCTNKPRGTMEEQDRP